MCGDYTCVKSCAISGHRFHFHHFSDADTEKKESCWSSFLQSAHVIHLLTEWFSMHVRSRIRSADIREMIIFQSKSTTLRPNTSYKESSARGAHSVSNLHLHLHRRRVREQSRVCVCVLLYTSLSSHFVIVVVVMACTICTPYKQYTQSTIHEFACMVYKTYPHQHALIERSKFAYKVLVYW